MRSRRRMIAEEQGTENFWPSFTDLTSTIALILFVLVLLAYLQNLIAGQRLSQLRSQQEETLRELQASQQQIQSAQRRLDSLSAAIRAGQAQLSLSEEKVRDQQAIIADSNRELEDVKARLQGMAMLRLSVLGKVKDSLESQLQQGDPDARPSVRLADNGNIVINENLVFEVNSHRIKDEGKPLLDTLARAFSNTLSDPEVRASVDVILVQGHTDARGTVEYNRDLSAKRANAVLNYMFEANPSLSDTYGRYFASSAYSEFRPLDEGTSEAAYQQNRRIEISVVLRDARMRDVIDEYMQGVDPALQGPKEP